MDEVDNLRKEASDISDKANERLQGAEERIEEIRKETDEVKKLYERKKAILIRRVSDYSKELEFWRNTIRKVLYDRLSTEKEAEIIITHVTNRLGTYGTRDSSAEEYETIEAMAKDMAEYEEKSNK